MRSNCAACRSSTKPRPPRLAFQTVGAAFQDTVNAMEPPKLKDLVEELHDVASKWRTVGVQLEIPTSTLKAIDYENRGNCNAALSAMLSEWTTQVGDMSWQAVIDALRTKSVGETALAADIELRRLRKSSEACILY